MKMPTVSSSRRSAESFFFTSSVTSTRTYRLIESHSAFHEAEQSEADEIVPLTFPILAKVALYQAASTFPSMVGAEDAGAIEATLAAVGPASRSNSAYNMAS